MTIYIQLALAAIIFALGLATGIKYESGEVLKLQVEKQTALVAAVAGARTQEQARITKVQEAQNADAKRTRAAMADAAAARTELDRVRDTLRAANGSPGESVSACRQRADAVSVVFSQCAGALVGVAEAADAQANAVKLLQDAWPK